MLLKVRELGIRYARLFVRSGVGRVLWIVALVYPLGSRWLLWFSWEI